MLSEYIGKKLKLARYKILKDGSYFGEIPGLRGVWANAKNLEDCREELRSALEDWVLFKLKEGDAVTFDVEDSPKGPNAVNVKRV